MEVRLVNKRSLCILLGIAFLLGLFFQYSRLDGFLHLGAVGNRPLTERLLRSAPTDEELPREKFLIIYDPTDVLSMYARHNMEKILTEKRKAFESRPLDDPQPLLGSYQGIALATGHLSSISVLPQIMDYARAGGTVLALQKIESVEERPIDAATLAVFGIAQLGAVADVYGIHIHTNFLVGGKDFRFGEGLAFTTQANAVTLTTDATAHITSVDGTPLLWEKPLGDGHIYAYNGVERDDKTNLGIYTALMAHCGTDTIYPVVGVKLFVLDDFPAPVPEGDFERIYNELGVDTETFYRKIWWPCIRRLAEEENIRYTGAIIETYGNQVKGPFRPLGGRAARRRLRHIRRHGSIPLHAQTEAANQRRQHLQPPLLRPCRQRKHFQHSRLGAQPDGKPPLRLLKTGKAKGKQITAKNQKTNTLRKQTGQAGHTTCPVLSFMSHV